MVGALYPVLPFAGVGVRRAIPPVPGHEPATGDAPGPLHRTAVQQGRDGLLKGRITVHSRVSVNPMCLISLPFVQELAALKRLEVQRAGLVTRRLAATGWKQALEIVAHTGIEVPYLVHGVYTPVDRPEAWKDETELLLPAIDAAAALGARFIYLTTGPPGSLRWEEAADAFGERLAPVLDRGREVGVELALENATSLRTDLSFVHTLRDTTRLARRFGQGVCMDLYCCWVEPELQQTVADNLDLIRLVQVSDFVIGTLDQPNRAVPGDGDLPLVRLLGDVIDTGYSGLMDIELLGPRIDAEGNEAALRRAIDWLSSTLYSLGVED